MRLTKMLLLALLALVAMAGIASAQTIGDCPECDEDGASDDSWYSSYDTGVVKEDVGGVLEDTDVSVGEGQHGKFTWLQYCLKFFDALGNNITLMFEAFVSEDGADVDAKANVNGVEVDLEDTLVGDLDDRTWGAAEPLPVEIPFDPNDLPEGVDEDACLYCDGETELPELPLPVQG